MGRLSVGLVGLGHLHPRSYMPIFAAAGFDVAAVSEQDPAILEPFAREFGAAGYADWREMIDRERLDLAAIYLPHAQCPETALACAARGIHILVEKPMAAESGGVLRMMDAANRHGVLLTTPYVWRYHPVARQMKRYADEGVLGRIVGCEGRCAAGRLHRYIDGNAGWMLRRALSGGGPMHNLGVHWIDLYRWLLQDEPVEVFGKNVKINQQYDIEDNSFALVTFSRGAVLALDISYTIPDSYPYGRDLYLSVRGVSGVVSWSPSFEGVHERLAVCSDAPEFADSPRRQIEFELEKHPGYSGILGVRYLRDVAEAIHTRGPAPISGEDGLRALETVEAIYESARTGRTAAVQVVHA
jgi:predicted dehydrogenase